MDCELLQTFTKQFLDFNNRGSIAHPLLLKNYNIIIIKDMVLSTQNNLIYIIFYPLKLMRYCKQ